MSDGKSHSASTIEAEKLEIAVAHDLRDPTEAGLFLTKMMRLPFEADSQDKRIALRAALRQIARANAIPVSGED